MVIDTKGDTGFVVPIRAAERLSNARFGVLPRVFDLWDQLETQNNVLNGRIKNLELQIEETTRIAETRKQEVDELKGSLEQTNKALKRKSLALRFFRGTTIALAIATATLLIVK